MYIEVVHDSQGNIVTCYCADTLPALDGEPIFTIQGGLPEGCAQARINIDTIRSMEIESACGQKAVIDQATGKAKIVTIDRSAYIIENFKVVLSAEITPPDGVSLPPGMKVRQLLRKI